MNRLEVKRRQIEMAAAVLGLISLLIFGSKLGNLGSASLIAAIQCFFFGFTLVSGRTAETLGRIIRDKKTKEYYKSVVKIKKKVMLFQSIFGLIVSLLLFFGAGVLEEYVLKIPYSKYLIMILAPTLFLRNISTVLQGYFQGEKAEIPCAISAVLRQIFLLGFGFLFCHILINYGQKVSALLKQESFSAMYGGIGIVISFAMSEILVLLFLAFVYKGTIKKEKIKENEGQKIVESSSTIFALFYGNKSILLLFDILGQFPILIGLILYQRETQDTIASAGTYGMFVMKYLIFCFIAICLIHMISFPFCGRILSGIRKKEIRITRSAFQGGIHMLWINSIYLTIFMGVLPKQVICVISNTYVEEAAKMIQVGSVLILFSVFVLYFSNLLCMMEKQYLVLGIQGILCVIYIVVFVLMLRTGKFGISAFLYTGLIYSGIGMLLYGFFAFRQISFKVDWLRVIVVPAVLSGVMGVIAFLFGKFLTPYVDYSNTFFIAFAVTGILYWILLLLLRNIKEQELIGIPCGKFIQFVGKLLRVF